MLTITVIFGNRYLIKNIAYQLFIIVDFHK